MARRKKGERVNGWVFLDKPSGLGSTQAVGKVRRIFNAQKAGHAGTLDPLATGLLAIALGKATKVMPHMLDADKTYSFTVKWGETTSTGDADEKAEVLATSDARPTREAIEAVVPKFLGEIEQIPPAYSALKIDGKRAYDLARAGEQVEIQPRKVFIEDLRLIECPDEDHASFNVTCEKGTYVRSLGLDIARALGTEGHLSALQRTASGGVSLDQAVSIGQLESAPADELAGFLHPIDAVLGHLERLDIKASDASKVTHGNQFETAHPDAEELLLTHAGAPLALACVEAGLVKPFRVFNLGDT